MPLAAHAERGPHPVGVVTLEIEDERVPGRKLPTDLWYPADASLRGRDLEPGGGAPHPFQQPHAALPDAPPATGRSPLLAFSHGNSGLRRQSTFLTTHLASWGFVVAAPDHTGNTFPEMFGLDDESRRKLHFEARRNRPRDLAAAIAAALAEGPGRPGVVPDRIGVFGHSYGGWTAFKLPRRDARVRAVCGLAPASEPFVGRKAFEPGELPFPAGVPSLLVAGRDDVLVDLETGVMPLFERLAPPRLLLGIERADHFHFCDGVELLHTMHVRNPRERQPRPTRPLEETLPGARMHRILCAVVTSFFRATLAGDGEVFAGLSAEKLAALDPAVRRLADGGV